MEQRRRAATECASKYILGEIIGVGADAKVRLAKRRSDGRHFAVKVLNRERPSMVDEAASNHGALVVVNKKQSEDDGSFSEEARRVRSVRVDREAWIHSRLLHHAHVVQCFDVFAPRESAEAHLVLEYCRGGTLLDHIASDECFDLLTEQGAAHIAKQVLEAIAFIHSHGVVHRDIKLENLLLRDVVVPGQPTSVHVKLTDFGCARHVVFDSSPNDATPDAFFFGGESANQRSNISMTPFTLESNLSAFALTSDNAPPSSSASPPPKQHPHKGKTTTKGIVPVDDGIISAPRGQKEEMMTPQEKFAYRGRAATPHVGTARYMAPEQFAGGSVEPALDLWSFGIVLCGLCTGSHPLRDVDERGWVDEMRRNQLPDRVSADAEQLWAFLPRARDLTAKLLRFDPTERLSAQQKKCPVDYEDQEGYDKALAHDWIVQNQPIIEAPKFARRSVRRREDNPEDDGEKPPEEEDDEAGGGGGARQRRRRGSAAAAAARDNEHDNGESGLPALVMGPKAQSMPKRSKRGDAYHARRSSSVRMSENLDCEEDAEIASKRAARYIRRQKQKKPTRSWKAAIAKLSNPFGKRSSSDTAVNCATNATLVLPTTTTAGGTAPATPTRAAARGLATPRLGGGSAPILFWDTPETRMRRRQDDELRLPTVLNGLRETQRTRLQKLLHVLVAFKVDDGDVARALDLFQKIAGDRDYLVRDDIEDALLGGDDHVPLRVADDLCEAFEQLSLTGSGRVSLAEFVAGVTSLRRRSQAEMTANVLRPLQGPDGRISAKALASALAALRMTNTVATAAAAAAEGPRDPATPNYTTKNKLLRLDSTPGEVEIARMISKLEPSEGASSAATGFSLSTEDVLKLLKDDDDVPQPTTIG